MALSLNIESLDAGYGAVRALRSVSLHVEAGETVALLGTNGNGKSTLMKCVMGLVRPQGGSVALTIDGKAHDLSKLSPEERAAFVKMLQDRAAARGVTLPGKVAPEPKELGQVLTDLHKKPGQLRDMLGGDAAQPQQQASASSPLTDILSSPMAKAVLAGIAAMVVKRVMGQA